MKVLLIILDGLADRPSEELGGRTPLEAASTPNLDRLASQGINGFMYPLAPGLAPSSDLAHFLLFGYSLEEFPGRGYFEAIGEGYSVQMGEVVLRTSFVTVEEVGERFEIVNRDIKVREEECRSLAEVVKGQADSAIKISFIYTGKRQGLLFLSGKVSHEITDSDPFASGLPVVKVQPLEKAVDRASAEQTARALNRFLIDTHDKLVAHPVNQERRKKNQPPLNFLTTKWAGRKRNLDSFWEKYGLRGASVASSPLFRGLAEAVGLDFVDQPEESHAGEDLSNRLRKAVELLAGGYDFIHIHTKAPDEAAHTKSPAAKKKVINRLDRAFSALLDGPSWLDDCLVIITADHATPSQGDLIHSGEAVPVLFLARTVGTDDVKVFDEKTSRLGSLGQISGRDLMPLILNYSDRIKYFGSRSFNRDYLTRPTKDRIISLRRSLL